MGYGKVLKEILDEKQMSVKTLSRNTGIPAPTIYSIIRRDTPIRYDTALRFANTLNIPLATICNENPYNEDENALPEVGKLIGMSDERSKKSYLSNRTAAIFTKFNYADLPKVDQLIADFFVLDDVTRGELFEYINLLKKNHSDPERVEILKEIKKLLGAKTGSPYLQGFPPFRITNPMST